MAAAVPLYSHGWMSADTEAMLSAAIEEYQPRVIVELGSWFGLSTCHMRRRAPDATIYAVDHFKNSAINEVRLEGVTPIDKLFLRHLRYETFHANMEATGGAAGGRGRTVMMKMDIREGLEALRSARVRVDMIFVDAEKKTKPLLSLLDYAQRHFPAAVIVGDDYVFPSVRAALKQYPRQRLVTSDGAYMVVPERAEVRRVQAAFMRLRAVLAPSAGQVEVLGWIRRGQYGSALDAAARHGMSLTSPLAEAAGGVVVHEIIRHARSEGAKGRERLREVWRRLLPDDGGAALFGHSLYNHASLTPFDYCTHDQPFS